MSDGIYEVFSKRNKKKEHILKMTRINKHVELWIDETNPECLVIHNKKQNIDLALKVETLRKILKKVEKCSTN